MVKKTFVIKMGFFRVIDKGQGITRLFIGGVHGKEGLTTIKAMKELSNDDVMEGKLVIYNCPESHYISTLDPLYYQSKIGNEILHLINYYKPDIYIEPHCYKNESYKKLIDLDRMKRAGVPPLIELECGVLIGSVSPQIRTTLFKREDVCITLEMPCSPSEKSLHIYIKFLKIAAGSRNRSELEARLNQLYPDQIKRARRYAREFFGDYPPF